MICIIHFTMRVEFMDIEMFAIELVIDAQEEQFAIKSETKSVTSIFERTM